MTTRTKQFNPSGIPTGPLKTIQEKTEQQKPKTPENPLSAFFRKSKMSLILPSHGNWYPKNGLTFDASGKLPVFAMNATDDIKFRTGDATMSGNNIYEVVKSCIPNISDPSMIPHVDIDSILLAIRVASYGPEFDFSVSVPNTTFTRTIKIDSIQLLNDISSRADKWDDEVRIEDETGQAMELIVNPVPLKNLFGVSKNIFILRRALTKNFDGDENIKDEASFSANMNELALCALNLLGTSIRKMAISDPSGNVLLSLDAANPQDEVQIKQTVQKLDVGYFNAIRDHIDSQRKKYAFFTPEQTSTPEEISAGAPHTWTAELTFMGSNFLPEVKTMV
jgi:hypothetical protein